MKTLLCITLVAGALAAPAMSFAQSAPAGLTRAQVRAELVSLEKVGYDESASGDINYPEGLQAAEAKLAKQQAHPVSADSVGGAAQAGASNAGAPSHKLVTSDLYDHP